MRVLATIHHGELDREGLKGFLRFLKEIDSLTEDNTGCEYVLKRSKIKINVSESTLECMHVCLRTHTCVCVIKLSTN